MLGFLLATGKATGRKLRLFAVAGARDLLAHNPDSDARGDYGDITWFAASILRAEAYADGLGPLQYAQSDLGIWVEARFDEDAAYAVLGKDADIGMWLRNPAELVPEVIKDFQVNPAHWLRCIFGNPFRPVSLAPAWLTPAVLKLAQAAYDDRILPPGHLDNTRLAVLADALEEAGCTDPDILSHVRGPGPHVRGCWPVDLLLGKE
jgi:hypothetical protein